ncbi:MAG: methanogenesis marker protein Mmp4/MtxX [Promethearchaeota archaeon]
MNFLDLFKSKTEGKIANLGIGLGNDLLHNLKILSAIEDFSIKNQCTIYLFGTKSAISYLLKEKSISTSVCKFIESIEPEKIIIEYLKKNYINAVIRGNLSSNNFLKNVKSQLHIGEINRLALLETFDQKQFFFGPVGIDECNDFQSKRHFIENAITYFKSLNIEPRISVLSGGRLNDVGRDDYVDKTIETAEKIVQYFKKKYSHLVIEHNQILIELAIKNQSNLIIAPDGISGNLIYRTLVHLGGGNAYGAIYMGLDYIIVDTSRVGKLSEIIGALNMAFSQVR